MAEFDAKAARAAGYSDADVEKIQQGIAAARAAGYSDAEIGTFLGGGSASAPQGQIPPFAPPPPATPPAPPPSLAREAAIAGGGLVSGAASAAGSLMNVLTGQVGRGGAGAPPSKDWGLLGALGVNTPPGGLVGAPPEPVDYAKILTDEVNSLGLQGPAPSSGAESYLSAGAKGVGGALAGPLGRENALRIALSGGLGGLVGHGVGTTGAPPWASALAGGGTSLATYGGLSRFLGGGIESIADKLGESKTLQQAGEKFQDLVRDWKQNVMPQKLTELYDPVATKVPNSAQVVTNNLSGTLHQLTTSGAESQGVVNRLMSRLPQDIKEQLEGLPGTTLTTPGGQTIQLGANLTWKGARAIRTALGDLIANPRLVQGADANTIDALYKGISADLGDTAALHGAASEWGDFNRGSTELYTLAGRRLGKIATDLNPTKETIDPEKAMTQLLGSGKAGGSPMQPLREALPEGMDELAAAMLRSNPKGWAKLSPEAKTALVPDPSLREAIDATRLEKGHSVLEKLTPLGEAALGGTLGEAAGDVAAHTLHMGVSPDVLRLSALLAPLIYHGGKNMLTDVEALKWAASGALAGAAANPLSAGKK